MVKIQLKHDMSFTGAHLFAQLKYGNAYTVLDKYSTMLKIVDSSGKDVWVSKTAFKKYFKEAK